MSLFGGPPNVAKLKAKRDLKGLFKALEYQKNAKIRKAAVEALMELGDPQAIEPLSAVMQSDPEIGIRWLAAEALGRIGDSRAVEPLIAALKNDGVGYAEYAAEALEKIVDERAIEPLLAALKDGRLSAIKPLRKIGGLNAALEPLITLLKNGDREAREIAAKTLGEIGDPQAIGPLIEALKPDPSTDGFSLLDKDKDRQEKAAAALGKLKANEAVEPLIDLFRNSRTAFEVRQAVADALGEIGDSRAVEPLLSVFDLGDLAGTQFRQAYMETMGLGSVMNSLVEQDSQFYRIVVNALGNIGDARAVAPLTLIRSATSDSRLRGTIDVALKKLKNAAAQ